MKLPLIHPMFKPKVMITIVIYLSLTWQIPGNSRMGIPVGIAFWVLIICTIPDQKYNLISCSFMQTDMYLLETTAVVVTKSAH